MLCPDQLVGAKVQQGWASVSSEVEPRDLLDVPRHATVKDAICKWNVASLTSWAGLVAP